MQLLLFRSFYTLILCVHLYFSRQTQSSSSWSILFLFLIRWMVCIALSFLFKLVQMCSVGFKSGSILGLTWKGQVIVFFPSTLETLLWCGQCALDHYYAGISLFCRLLEIRSHGVRQYFGTFIVQTIKVISPAPFAPMYPHLIKHVWSHLNWTYLYCSQLPKERAPNIHRFVLGFFFPCPFFSPLSLILQFCTEEQASSFTWTPSTELNVIHCPSQLSEKLWFPFITPVPSLKHLPNCFSELDCASSALLVASF